jgi:hypothetical protein
MPGHLGSFIDNTLTPVNMTVGQNVKVQGVVWRAGATLGRQR